MAKYRAAPPKCLFHHFHVTIQIEKDQHTLIEQSAHLVLFKISIYTNTTYTAI